MPTMAETWLAEGRVQGRAEGKTEGLAEGKADILLVQLERRFGALPEGVEARVQTATADELEAWAQAVLDARDLDEVFAGRLAH